MFGTKITRESNRYRLFINLAVNALGDTNPIFHIPCQIRVKFGNENLRKIGAFRRSGRGGKKTFFPICPNISTYWARHTWATIASELDIPIETIGLALGHKVGSSVTNIYIRYNPAKSNRLRQSYIQRKIENPEPHKIR